MKIDKTQPRIEAATFTKIDLKLHDVIPPTRVTWNSPIFTTTTTPDIDRTIEQAIYAR